jgi:hypothetical protein
MDDEVYCVIDYCVEIFVLLYVKQCIQSKLQLSELLGRTQGPGVPYPRDPKLSRNPDVLPVDSP